VIYKYAGKDGSKTYNAFHAANLIEKSLSPSDKKGDFDTSTVTETWLEAQKEELASEPEDPNEKPPLSAIINLDDFEKAFAKSGSQKANAYISGASNDLLTLNANKTFWQRLWFRPRVMRNVSAVNTKMRMLGVDVAMPVWICPMGIAKTAGQEGEGALARGAKSAGIVHCVSTTASMGVEEIVASGEGNPFFFQLYVDKQRHKTEAVLKQLEGLPQVKALFVTADLAVVSKREADERIKTQVSVSVYSNGKNSAIDKKGGGLARSTGSFIDWSLSWDDLPWLRKHTRLPILVKGIQSAADAKTALDLGCDGIVVSNHGGRALDSAPATILTLLEIRRDCPEVFDKMEVLVDGGVRRGSDVLKAVLLGAKGIGVGRPFQCSVMYDTEGVEHCADSKLYFALDLWVHANDGAVLRDELETAMRLCGITDLNQVRGDMSWLNTAELEKYLPPTSVVKSGWLSSLFKSKL
jgi:L-lactate dehydrogenase (cytochrome)